MAAIDPSQDFQRNSGNRTRSIRWLPSRAPRNAGSATARDGASRRNTADAIERFAGMRKSMRKLATRAGWSRRARSDQCSPALRRQDARARWFKATINNAAAQKEPMQMRGIMGTQQILACGAFPCQCNLA